MKAAVYDDRTCELGEGPLWHPRRRQLFWFDILGKRLMTRAEGPRHWQFDEHVSAAGWVDDDTLLIASESALFRFDLSTGQRDDLAALEADNPATRSNDGRADPQGGFWIGTMGKNAEAGAGAIYRYFRGRVERLYTGITISNAISFSPDGTRAYFTDTPTRQIMVQALDHDGWPVGKPDLFVDLRKEGLNPDGAVVDAEGCLWVAEWGASRVARHGPDGKFLAAITFPALHVSCPAFGAPDCRTLFVTSARQGLAEAGPDDGRTFSAIPGVAGQAEHRVILG